MSNKLKLFLYYFVLPILILAQFPHASAQAPSPPSAINVSNFLIQNISGRSQILPLIGIDADGTIVSFTITTLPSASAGVLYLNNTAVTVNQVITPADAQKLQFEVLTTFNGTASFTYTVTDNSGLTDTTPATFTVPVTNNGALLVCTGGGLGTNILGASGTFSAPYITPVSTTNCINDGHNVAAPLKNLGKLATGLPALSNYVYASTSNSLGPEGTYSFLNTMGTMDPALRNCIKTDWVASDHTGDGGYAMIVNGSPNVNSFGKTFYQATSIAVCPNTLYEFSAYVINVLPGNSPYATAGTQPNISFHINNQLVSTSGPIAYSTAATSYTPQWVKVGGLWYSGPNTSVDLRIDNATFVAQGNDLGLDDISLAICGPDISYPNISLTPKFCSYGVLPLKAEVNASINTYSSYIFQQSIDGGNTWTDLGSAQTGSPVYDSGTNGYVYTANYGDIPINPSMNGYRYRLKVATNAANLSGNNCNISADKVITVSAFTMPSGGADIVSCTPISGAALAAAQPGETWSASPSNPSAAAINQSGQVTGITADGIYEFYLANAAGCIDTVKVTRSQVQSAGADAVVCSSETSFKFADAPAGYEWKVVTGNPAGATIDPATGYVSNLGADGDYQFQLVSKIGPCMDIVKLTKGICPTVGFRAASSSYPEKSGVVTIEVFLNQATTLPVTAPYALGIGTATNVTDFTALVGNIEFNPGETSKLITVNLIDDTVIEPDETVLFNLASPTNATLGTIQQHILNILNDDAAICIAADNAVRFEGQPVWGTSTAFTFKVSRSAGSYLGDPIVFSYKLSALTASFDTSDLLDATDLNKVVQGTIPAGQSDAEISYSIKTDLLIEGDETFKVELTNADNGVSIDCPDAQGIVLNDDLNETIIQFEKIATSTSEGNVSVLLKVILSNPAPKAIDVPFTLTDITATRDVDYADIPALQRKVHFDIGDSEAFITISIKEDSFDEPDETFSATLIDPADIQFILGSQTVHTVTIIDDDPIIVADDNFSTNEDTPFSNTVKNNDYDPGGDPLTFTLLTQPQHGQLTFNSNGSFTYTPNPDYYGNDTFTYRACNVNNMPSCGDATAYITVIPINDPPDAIDDQLNGIEDSPLSGTVAANDSDADGDALGFTRLTNPSHGALIFNSDGSFTYTPNPDFNGTDSFSYQTCDPSGACDMANVRLLISPVNDPPVAVNDSLITSECQTVTGSVALNDSDPDNALSELSFSLVGAVSPSIGSLTLLPDGRFTFTPAGRFTGSIQVTYRVTDPLGLFHDGILTITQPNPPLQIVLRNKSDLRCFGDNSGAISVDVSGGLAPYTFTWNNGGAIKDLTNLAAGSYNLTVTDSNGCTATFSTTIAQPSRLNVAEIHQDVTCYGAANGSITLNVSGGTAPYTYLWNNGSNTQNLSGLLPGSYNVAVTDANGCNSTLAVLISQPAELAVTETYQNLSCFSAGDGRISLIVSGGSAPYTFLWSNASTNKDLTSLAAGSYSVTVKDAAGCTKQLTVTITQPDALRLTETHRDVSCFGSSDGKIDITVAGGTAPYNYKWSNRLISQDLDDIPAGNYSLTVTDAAGCSEVITVRLTQPAALTATIKAFSTSCKSTPDGKVQLSVSGGTAPYTFVWNGNPTLSTQNLAGVNAGKYTVVIKDHNNCSLTLNTDILPGNCGPMAVNDEFRGPVNTKIANSVALNDTDPDQDKLTFTNSTNPQHGAFVFKSDGSFTFSPDPDWLGTTTFNYSVCDASGACSAATVTLVIAKTNRPPIAVNDTYQTPIGVPLVIRANGILANDYDPDNDPITAVLQVQPLHARVELKPDGSFVYTPERTFQGEDFFTYFANDGLLNSNVARVTVNIPGNSSTAVLATVNLTPPRKQISEGDTTSVTATLTNDLPEDVTINLAFSGTATNTTKFEGNDYKLSGNYLKIRIPAGQVTTTEKFTVEALPDNLKEGDEYINAKISSVSTPNALIGSDATIIIKDIYPPVAVIKNEPPPNPDILPDPYVSPNGDGKGNEAFIISNINLYPDNEVVIFNRWGNEIFRIQSYNNTTNVFKGKANKGLMTNTAADLPEGVYYFLIYSRTALQEPRLNKGYIILKR